MKRKILALDVSTHCGWAHSNGPSGVWHFKINRDESSGMRLVRLEGKLNEVCDSLGVNLVLFEAARCGAPNMQGALVVQAELQGIIKAWCEKLHIEYRGYSSKEIKVHATGKGNANKPKMEAAAKLKWPNIEIEDDNHADALWLLDLGMQEYMRVVNNE
jgi:Holliday junction resolvasome RuvABC endonuclease subunit